MIWEMCPQVIAHLNFFIGCSAGWPNSLYLAFGYKYSLTWIVGCQGIFPGTTLSLKQPPKHLYAYMGLWHGSDQLLCIRCVQVKGNMLSVLPNFDALGSFWSISIWLVHLFLSQSPEGVTPGVAYKFWVTLKGWEISHLWEQILKLSHIT